jgi:hypothetical protein
LPIRRFTALDGSLSRLFVAIFERMHPATAAFRHPLPPQGLGLYAAPRGDPPCSIERVAKIPIARALARGFVQPDFNEIAPLRPSSATLLARPHRNLSIIT